MKKIIRCIGIEMCLNVVLVTTSPCVTGCADVGWASNQFYPLFCPICNAILSFFFLPSKLTIGLHDKKPSTFKGVIQR